MNKQKQKAKQAVKALRAVGIETARAGDGDLCMVTISPEDAMKMLLFTDADRQKLFVSEKISASVRAGINKVEHELQTLKEIAAHTPEKCAKGDHILDSYTTGGRSGHVITRCLVCNYKTEGWD